MTALAIIASLAVAGCGGDKKTIPNDEGASLIRALRQARDATGDPQKCPQLAAAVDLVRTRVVSLPSSVDRNTRDSLVNGVNHLIDNANNECKNAQTTPTTTTPPTTPTDTTPTAPTTPSNTTPTTPSNTTPTTPTTPSNTTPTTPTAPGNGGTGPGNGGTPPGQGKKDKGGKKGHD